jgi:hypothetical protein
VQRLEVHVLVSLPYEEAPVAGGIECLTQQPYGLLPLAQQRGDAGAAQRFFSRLLRKLRTDRTCRVAILQARGDGTKTGEGVRVPASPLRQHRLERGTCFFPALEFVQACCDHIPVRGLRLPDLFGGPSLIPGDDARQRLVCGIAMPVGSQLPRLQKGVAGGRSDCSPRCRSRRQRKERVQPGVEVIDPPQCRQRPERTDHQLIILIVCNRMSVRRLVARREGELQLLLILPEDVVRLAGSAPVAVLVNREIGIGRIDPGEQLQRLARPVHLPRRIACPHPPPGNELRQASHFLKTDFWVYRRVPSELPHQALRLAHPVAKAFEEAVQGVRLGRVIRPRRYQRQCRVVVGVHRPSLPEELKRRCHVAARFVDTRLLHQAIHLDTRGLRGDVRHPGSHVEGGRQRPQHPLAHQVQ